MNNWLKAHFLVQQGMYFDSIDIERDMVYFGSNSIEDSIWNYGTINIVDEKNIVNFRKFCEIINKPCNLYMEKEAAKTNNEVLNHLGFYTSMENNSLTTETWMKFEEKRYDLAVKREIELVTNSKQKKDFLDVFISAYGGQKTPEKPYGNLPQEYAECLSRSFSYRKFYNFIAFHNGQAVSIASLCMVGDAGGIYNVGTRAEYERQGYGLAVTDACIKKWKEQDGQVLFLQTETGTGIDDWYERIGFNRVFEGVIYEHK